MHKDMFGNFTRDYVQDPFEQHTRGTFAEELEEALRRNPALLLPSPAQEAEWIRMTEEWDAQEQEAGREAE